MPFLFMFRIRCSPSFRRGNVVVIDLIRSGRSVYEAQLEQIPNQHRAPYCIWIWCAGKPETFFYYPICLQDSLARIPLPLRPETAPVNLDLQPLLERVYANGSYGYSIDYTKPPDPPLDKPDAAWAREWLATHLD